MRLCLMMFIFINAVLCMLADDMSDDDDYDADLMMMRLKIWRGLAEHRVASPGNIAG